MEAKEVKMINKRITERTLLSVDDKVIYLEYYYRSYSDMVTCSPSLLIITYDGELTDDIIKSVVESYSGEYSVFHIFKSEKLYASDITLYMKYLFNIEEEDVENE